MLKTYLVRHSHRHGEDIYKFSADRKELQDCVGSYNEGCDIDADVQTIINALGIDFEPEREEYLDIELDDIVAKYIP